MILSSADILRILGSSEIIRLSAKIKIADGRPALSGAEGMCIYVSRFPALAEFEATWTLYIENDDSEPEDLVISEIKRLLPSVRVTDGLLTAVTTTDFLSESTQRAPEASVQKQSNIGAVDIEERFQALSEDVNDRMLLVSSGRNGAAGVDGRDGADGRDGRDLLATDAELFDLRDAGPSVIGLKKGQVLTWDGSQWTNLYVPTTSTVSGGGGGAEGGGGGIEEAPTDGRRYVRESAAWSALTPSDQGQGGLEEAPLDGNYYVRSDGKWLNMVSVLDALGYNRSDILDGGDFTNVTTDATDDAVIDAGDFT